MIPADDDFWIALDAPERFAAWAVSSLDLTTDPVVTLREPNRVAFDRYGRRLASGHLLRSLDSMLAAHVLAADAIRAVRPSAHVTMVTAPFPYYELEQLLWDVLGAPAAGIARPDIGPYLVGRRQVFYAGRPRPSVRERAWRRFWGSVIPLAAALPRSIAATYASSMAAA